MARVSTSSSGEAPRRTATYKGRKYLLEWSGKTKYGERAHLWFMDQSKDFWVDAKLLTNIAFIPQRKADGSNDIWDYRKASEGESSDGNR